MVRPVVWTVVFSAVAAVLQSTLLRRIALHYPVPNLALCVVVYSAYVNGAMAGQVSGFFAGLLLDFLSAAPLGLNALICTLVGVLTGLMKGTFFLNFFLPIALCAAATLVRAASLFILHILFGGAVPSYSLTGQTLWIELALNALCAPFLFALLKRFRPLLNAGGNN